MTAVTRKASNATQLSVAAIVKVPNGGRKKKLKQSIARIDAASAGRLPQRVAMNKTVSSRASETVAALTCAPTVFSSNVNKPTLNTAAT